MENILFKIKNTGKMIELRTIARNGKKHARFLIWTDDLKKWLNDPDGRFMDMDCGNVLEIRRGRRPWVRILWLETWGSGRIEGLQQSFTVAYEALQAAVCPGAEFSVLCKPEDNDGTLEFTPSAHRNIGAMNMRERRAFCKAMARGSMRYPGTQTVCYADGPRDFFFRCTPDGLCGGLIRSAWDGKIRYTVHT